MPKLNKIEKDGRVQGPEMGIKNDEESRTSTESPELQELPREMPKDVEQEKINEIKDFVEKTDKPSGKTPPPQVSSPLIKDEDLMNDLASVMSMDKPKQVKVLVYLAFKKGVHHAAGIAKKIKDPYLIDAFHDTLVDELYGLLKKKKKIK